MSVSTPEQVEELIKLGLHKAIGCHETELEACAGRPPEKKGWLLVVSEKALIFSKQCELIGIQCPLSLSDLEKHRNIISVPDRFLFWVSDVDDGRMMRNKEPDEVVYELKEKNRYPATTAIVLAIFRKNHKVMEDNLFIDAAGSRIDDFFVPALMLNNGDSCLKKFAKTERTSEKWGVPSFAKAV